MIPIDLVVMTLTIIGMPLVLMLVMRQKVAGKMLCLFLEKDNSLRPKLLPISGDFVHFEGDTFEVNTDLIRIMRYPMGWPMVLQQVIPVALYDKVMHEQKDWKDLSKVGVSAKKVGAALSPYWLAMIVSGSKEGAPMQTRWQRMAPGLAVATSGLCFVMILYIISKIGELQTAIDALNAALK